MYRVRRTACFLLCLGKTGEADGDSATVGGKSQRALYTEERVNFHFLYMLLVCSTVYTETAHSSPGPHGCE